MIASTATSLLFVVISQVRCYQVKLSDSVTKIELVFDKRRLLSEQSVSTQRISFVKCKNHLFCHLSKTRNVILNFKVANF